MTVQAIGTALAPSTLKNLNTASHATRLRMVMLATALVLFPFIASHFGNSWVRIMDMVLLYIMLALGLNIVVGFAGLLDLGYIAFYAVGAYMTGLLASPQFAVVLESIINTYPLIGNALLWALGPEIARSGIHLSVWFIVPLGAALAALFGALLGAPTLKLRGDYLAVVTLGFGEIIRIFIINLNAPVNITDGPKGINMIDPIRVFGVSLAGEPGAGAIVNIAGLAVPSVNAYYFLFLLLCTAIIVVSLRLQDSRLGRAFMAIREDEVAAKAMGINTRNVKLLAFALGSTTHAMMNPAHTTTITFSQAIRLPGVALGAGTYIFERVLGSNPDLIVVRSRDRAKVYFMGNTERVSRPRGASLQAPVVTLGEARPGAPVPIVAWYPSGSTRGHRFVYPGR